MHERIQTILTNLEATGEDLLALSDDIWLNIDHNDNAAVEEGVRFKRALNEEVAAFQAVAGRLSALVADFTRVPGFQAPDAPDSNAERERRERVIGSLDRRTPHGLDEDFCYKRPAAFKLDGVPFDGTNTWAQVHETLCRHLAALKPGLFDALPEHAEFISVRGNRYFSRNPEELRKPVDFGRSVLAETNLRANQIRDNITRLLAVFGLPAHAFVVYLREDRDAIVVSREHGTLEQSEGFKRFNPDE